MSTAPALAPARATSAPVRLVANAAWRLRRLLGWRRTVRIDRVRYTERTAEPLHRAMSRHGPGVKDYDVEFPSGPRMRITCTRDRVYADLARPERLEPFQAAESVVKPGMRALIVEGGTGWAGERLSRRVGPSGAVVSLDRDEESAKFAQRRYRLSNTAYEAGHVEALKGETDESFDAVIAIEALGEGDAARDALKELWRVVRAGGTLVLGARAAEPQAQAGAAPPDPIRAIRDVVGPMKIDPLSPVEPPWTVLAVSRPAAP